MPEDGGRIVGLPFVDLAPVNPLMVVGVGVPSVVTGECVVMKSLKLAPFDPSRPLGVDE